MVYVMIDYSDSSMTIGDENLVYCYVIWKIIEQVFDGNWRYFHNYIMNHR